MDGCLPGDNSIQTHFTSEKESTNTQRILYFKSKLSSSSASCLQASCLSSSGLWTNKVGSFPSFQIPNKEEDSIFGSEYVSHEVRDPDQTILLSSNLCRTIENKIKSRFHVSFSVHMSCSVLCFSTTAPALTQTH